jgi:hypothetical protein
MWNGTATNVVDLNPPGFTESEAFGVFGTTQVGSGLGPATDNRFHALMWHGTADGFVDLHPAGFSNSYARKVSATKQLGNGNDGRFPHGLLWSGSAESVVNLSPAGMRSSAWDMAGDMQVGSAQPVAIESRAHAYIWRGTAASGVDLHPYVVATLGPEFLSSGAVAVTENGDVYGAAGNFAVKWTPVPEPRSAVMLVCATCLGFGSRFQRQVSFVFG